MKLIDFHKYVKEHTLQHLKKCRFYIEDDDSLFFTILHAEKGIYNPKITYVLSSQKVSTVSQLNNMRVNFYIKDNTLVDKISNLLVKIEKHDKN